MRSTELKRISIFHLSGQRKQCTLMLSPLRLLANAVPPVRLRVDVGALFLGDMTLD
jgi:hypothetical protein